MNRTARMPRAAALVLFAMLLTTSLGARDASGATTLGSPLDSPASDSYSCGFGLDTRWTFSFAQTALPGATLVAPFDGIIVRWRLRAVANGAYAAVNDTVRLDVLDGDFGIVRSSEPSLLYPGPFGQTGPETRQARLPIAAGQRIGVTGDVIRTPTISGHLGASPAQGRLSCHGMISATGSELLLNADVEPDRDGDGYGDESQDGCPSRPDLQGPCPAIPSSDGGTAPAPPAGSAPPGAPAPASAAPASLCRVPSLIGSTVTAARKRLRANGCALGRVRTERRPHRRAGRVLRQSRRPGTRLTAPARVSVTVTRRS
jgi:hypothetical protein